MSQMDTPQKRDILRNVLAARLHATIIGFCRDYGLDLTTTDRNDTIMSAAAHGDLIHWWAISDINEEPVFNTIGVECHVEEEDERS